MWLLVLSCLQVNGCHACFACRQFGLRRRAEAGDDNPFMLHRFRIIERRLAKGRMFPAFNADDFGNAVAGGEFELISSQWRAPGIYKNVHRAESARAGLICRLREKFRPGPNKQRQHQARTNKPIEPQKREEGSVAELQLNHAKRLECAQLAAAVEYSRSVECLKSTADPAVAKSASKLCALQTLRAAQGSASFFPAWKILAACKQVGISHCRDWNLCGHRVSAVTMCLRLLHVSGACPHKRPLLFKLTA